MYHLPFEPRPSSWLLCHYFKVEMLGRVIVRVLLAQRALLRVYGVLLAVAVVLPRRWDRRGRQPSKPSID